MSGYFAASAIAAELMAPSQPWSAAGPENPMTMVSPSSLFSALLVGPASVVPVVPVVQPASRPATTNEVPTATSALRRDERVPSMWFLQVNECDCLDANGKAVGPASSPCLISPVDIDIGCNVAEQ
jgi:hypothetical protein